MKQIQIIFKRLARRHKVISEKEQKVALTNAYLISHRRRFVADAPMGFKSRSSSDYFLQN
jgi:hypothetical protein